MYKLIEDSFMVKTIDHGPMRPHRKKRIAKKWLKRYGRRITQEPLEKVILMGDTIIGHPVIISKIKMELMLTGVAHGTYDPTNNQGLSGSP